jgi:hypothetical protein
MSFRSNFNKFCHKVADKLSNLGTVRTIIRVNGVNIESSTGLDKADYIAEQEALGYEVIAYAGRLIVKEIEDYEELESNI